MDGIDGIAIVGIVAAFWAGASACDLLAGWTRRQRAGSLPNASEGPSVARTVMRRGIGALMPASQWLRRFRAVERYSDEGSGALRECGIETSGESFLSVALAGAAAALAAGALVSGTAVGAVAVALFGAVLFGVWARSRADAALEREREGVPGVLSSMDSCLKSGFSLPQTFDFIAAESRGALGARFARASRVVKTGGTVAEALACVREGAAVSELAFASVVLDVQHVAGGSVAHVLESTRRTVKEEMELRRALRVQTAQARLSAQVVSVMPFALVALCSLASEDFLVPFFESAAGMALLATAIAMQAVGIAAVRRMLRVGE